MLLLVLLLSIVRQLQGAPTNQAPLYGMWPDTLLRDKTAVFDDRQARDIVQSCIATILVCTWTAVHPDIPGLTDSGFTRLMKHVTMMLLAILAPELMAIRAMRQRFAAKAIAKKYNEEIVKNSQKDITLYERLEKSTREWFYGPGMPKPLSDEESRPWTTTHGFFFLMGGFMLCRNGIPTQTLTSVDSGKFGLRNLIEQGVIDAPRITKAEIQDRSKANSFSKGIVAIQTSWFVARCITRWWAERPVTELEVLTLCFVVVNLTTTFLWLDKPQRVGIPILLNAKTKSVPDVKVAPSMLTENAFMPEKSSSL